MADPLFSVFRSLALNHGPFIAGLGVSFVMSGQASHSTRKFHFWQQNPCTSRLFCVSLQKQIGALLPQSQAFAALRLHNVYRNHFPAIKTIA